MNLTALSQDNQIQGFIKCSISLVEVVSNLRRLVGVDEILNEEEFTLVKGTFLNDIKNGTLEVIEITTPIILASLDICCETYVTPMDSIH